MRAPWRLSPASTGWLVRTSRWNGQIWPPWVCPESCSATPAAAAAVTWLGWQPLVNEHRTIGDGLVVAGVDDPTGAPDLAAALAGADLAKPVLLLAHQPSQVTAAAAAGVALQLSGHTHGGQIWPFHFLVRTNQPVLAGLSRHGARTQLYVSRGTGFWGPPLRVFAPSEITVLTLGA